MRAVVGEVQNLGQFPFLATVGRSWPTTLKHLVLAKLGPNLVLAATGGVQVQSVVTSWPSESPISREAGGWKCWTVHLVSLRPPTVGTSVRKKKNRFAEVTAQSHSARLGVPCASRTDRSSTCPKEWGMFFGNACPLHGILPCLCGQAVGVVRSSRQWSSREWLWIILARSTRMSHSFCPR